MTPSASDIFPIIDVDPGTAEDIEQLGAKRKFWFRRESDKVKWLFKADERVAGGQVGDGPALVGIGDDWAEKIACEVCRLLGIPHVEYELAIEQGTRVNGVICPNVAAKPRILLLGNQLMLERDPKYPADFERKYGVREHTCEAVIETVARLNPPPKSFCGNMPAGITSAVDVFVGYILLDALIANQDRHHQNWAALREHEVTLLAPTFDHGAALARNEPDIKRERRLRTNDRGFGIEAFAAKARSSFYRPGGKRPISTAEAFAWMATKQPSAGRAWLDRLGDTPPDVGHESVRCITGDSRDYNITMNSLYVAWHTSDPPPVWGPVGRLDYDAGIYRFQYTRGARTLHCFHPFDGMPDLEQIYESSELFPLFKNRLLPESRPEFRAYLEWSGFNPDDPPEPLLILGRTEGRKQTDTVQVFPCPVPDSHGCYVNYFFAHGIRYHMPNAGPVLAQLRDGDRLQLRPHPHNPVDPNAVAIFAHDTMLGYIPRYLAADVGRLIRECPEQEVRLTADRVNLDAPMQQRLHCRLNACWPAGFQPCQGEQFELISQNHSTPSA